MIEDNCTRSKSTILIVDDEKKIGEILKEILESEGYRVQTASTGSDAWRILQAVPVHLVLLDIKLPDTDGLTLLKRIKRQYPEASVVMISAFGTVQVAVQSLKSGAEDFIEKPLEATRVLTTIRNTLEKSALRQQSTQLKSQMLKDYPLLGNAQTVRRVLELVNKIAPTDTTILIRGETGTGKDLVARNIHIRSLRAAQPFVKLNCAALPGELIESELFGYEKGAFTGAYARKSGQFELAHCGTLFLDEIGDMTLPAQAKVLRAIEEREIMRLGGTKPMKVDVRLIIATNQNLETLIKAKQFREDLFHRINVIRIELPTLRERRSDIPLLAEHFLKSACINNNRPIKTFRPRALNFLSRQPWPGNVRELKHLMEKISILAESTTLDIGDLAGVGAFDETRPVHAAKNGIGPARSDFERHYIIAALDQAGWQIARAARALNLDRSTLFRKMRKLGIKK